MMVLRRLFCAPAECESADNMDAEQLATAHCPSAQQSGGGSMYAHESQDMAGKHAIKTKMTSKTMNKETV